MAVGHYIKMLHKIVLLSIVGVALGWGLKGGKMMKVYLEKAMMTQCMGPEPYEKLMTDFMVACQKCEQQGLNKADAEKIDFQSVINEIRRNAVPWGSRASRGLNLGAPAQFIPYPVFLPGFGNRTKRQAVSGSEKLEMMKEKMTHIIGNATCVFKEMKLINDDKTVNYDTYKQWTTDLKIDEDLKEDLLYAHDCCKDMSMCMPVEKSRNPIMKEFGQLIVFQGCVKMKTAMCCMKQDFKKMALEMGMDNIDASMDMGMGMMGMGGQEGEFSNMNAIEQIIDGDMMF